MMFKPTFGDKRAYIQLRRVADSLEFIAMYLAREKNIQYMPSGARVHDSGKEEPEVLHTDDAEMLAIRLREYSEFNDRGYDD